MPSFIHTKDIRYALRRIPLPRLLCSLLGLCGLILLCYKLASLYPLKLIFLDNSSGKTVKNLSPMGRTAYYETLLEQLLPSRNKCLDCLVEGKAEEATKEALMIYKRYPNYLLLASYETSETSPSLLRKILSQKEEVDPHLLILLLNDDNTHPDIRALSANICSKMIGRFSNARGDDFLALILRMECILNGVIVPSAESLNSLIDKLDDARLYRYARSAGIDILPKNTTNFYWHRIFLGDSEAASAILHKSTSFKDIEIIIKTVKDVSLHVPALEILAEYLQGVTTVRLNEMTHTMIEIYKDDPSFFNTKILLALLISSKTASNLALALYIAFKEGPSDNYEILLIKMFICRYFCFVPEILRLYEKLSIRNLQLYNTTYVWSDPLFVSSKASLLGNMRIKKAMQRLKIQRDEDLKKIKSNLAVFISKDYVGQAVSLIKLYKKISLSVVCKEIESKEILAKKETAMFSDLLGGECAYLFGKATTGMAYHERFCIPDGSGHMEILDEIKVMPISNEFKEYFVSCWNESC